jgi:rRNA maturation protein Nop10
MRLLYAALILLGSGGGALAQDRAPNVCRPEDSCPPAPAHDGICEHPSFEGTASYPFSNAFESRCILRAKPFAVRRGDALRLTFRDGTARAYRDNWNAKACEQGPYEGCKQYVLYDYLPQHKIFVVEVVYFESNEWLLIWQQNGKEEKVVAPPRYSPDKKWLASVYATEGPDDGNNGIDIVPSKFDSTERSWHYRPREYELWNFVGWDGDERLALTVYWRAEDKPELVTWPAEVVHLKSAWQLNRWAPVAPRQ